MEKEGQVRDFEILKPAGKGLMDAGLGDDADSGKVEVRVVAGNENLGQAPKREG